MNKIFLFAATALALTACSNDEPGINSGEPVAARVTANINVPQSRAYNQTWESGDAIGISTTSGGKTQYANMKYSTIGDGNFTHVGGDAMGIFFQNTDEVTFSAYYPFIGNENTAAGTIDNVTTENQANQKQFDFLFASGAKASRANSTLSFTGGTAFEHKMTRLILRLQTDATSGFEATEVSSGTYVLNGLKHSGTFNTSTGEAIATGDASTEWAITAQASDADNVRTYSMILYPQTGANLTLKATIDNVDYTCRLNPALSSGVSYTYTITVKKTGLVVSDCTISDWQDGGNFTGDATMPGPMVGDYYYSDGTYSTAFDPAKQAIGIVFTTDPDRIGEGAKAVLAAKGVTPHGLVMALTNATSDNPEWAGYLTDELVLTATDNLRKMFQNVDGYAETHQIIDPYHGNLNAEYPAFYNVSQYGMAGTDSGNYAAPGRSTGWFMPSIGQWWDIMRNLGNVEALDAYKDDTSNGHIRLDLEGDKAIENINSYLSGIPDSDTISRGDIFWTSSEFDVDNAISVQFKSDRSFYFIRDYKEKWYYVRCVLAF